MRESKGMTKRVRGLKRGGGKNARRKNGEASDVAVAAPGPYRPPPTPDTHTLCLSPSLSFLSVFATASTPMTFKRFYARTRPPVSTLLSYSHAFVRVRRFVTAGRVHGRPENVRGSSISAAREFDGAGRVAGHTR